MNFRSYYNVYQYTFRWTIDNISQLPNKWSETSPYFIVEPQSKWHIKMWKDMTKINLYIFWKNKQYFKNKFEILVSSGNKYEFRKIDGTCKEFQTEVSIGGFWGEAMDTFLNDQAIFTISFKVWAFQSDTLQTSKTVDTQQDYLHTLKSKLNSIFTNYMVPDVTFHMQGVTLSAHKVILMEKSEVFNSMFETELKDKTTDKVKIEDVKINAMKALLRFVYSGEVTELDLDSAMEVYDAAEKFAILDLKEICRCMIASKVKIETATDVLIFAKAHNDTSLRDCIMQYIAFNYGSNQNEVQPYSADY